MSENLKKALLLKQLYLKKLCGERYCQSDFTNTPQKPIISQKSKMSLEQIISTCALCELSKSANEKRVGEIVRNSKLCFITQKPILPYSASFEMVENIAKRVFGIKSYSLLSLIKCDTHIPSTALHAKICFEYLSAQMEAIQSHTRLFVLFGEEVAHFVLKNDESLEILRTRIISANKSNFIVTFHIGDLLKNQSLKKAAMSDFAVAKDFLAKSKM